MKTINLLVSVSIAILSTYQVSAQKKYFETNNLSVKGQALLHGSPSSSYTVSVYLSGHKIDSMKSKSKRPIYFNFKFDEVYSICYQKEGCEDKIIMVDTRVPKGLKELDDDTHDFEVEMSQDLVKTNRDTEDFPIAILSLDKHQRALVLCEKYNAFIHKEDVYVYVPKM